MSVKISVESPAMTHGGHLPLYLLFLGNHFFFGDW